MNTQRLSDKDLITRILSGHPDLFGPLVERHIRAAHAIAYARLGNTADAEDAVQESFLRAYERLATLRDPAKFAAWLLTITRHEAGRVAAKRHDAPLPSPDIGVDSAYYAVEETLTHPDPAQHELNAILRDHLLRLPEPAREVLLLHYFAGHSARDIATLLDLRRAAVLKRLQRAREQLAETMLRDLEIARPTKTSLAKQVVRIVAFASSLTIPAAMANAATVSTVAKAGTVRYLLSKSFITIAASIVALNAVSLWWIASHYLGDRVLAQQKTSTDGPAPLTAKTDIDARDFLRKIQAAQSSTPPLIRNVVYQSISEFEGAPEKHSRTEMTIGAYLGETRAARRNTQRSWQGSDESIPPHEDEHLDTWDGQRYFSFGRVISPPEGGGYWLGGTSETPIHGVRLHAQHNGGELTGYLYGDYVPYYEVLADAKDVTVVLDDTSISGVSTYRIEAKTKRGFYRVWVDPAQNYHLRKAILERSADDLDWGDIPLSKQEWMPKKNLKYTLTIDEFKSFEGRIFPVRGHTVTESVYLTPARGFPSSTTNTDIHITSIQLNPDADALRAFVPNAPPNTIVTDWDRDRQVVWTGNGLSDDESLLETAQAQLEEIMRANPVRSQTGK